MLSTNIDNAISSNRQMYQKLSEMPIAKSKSYLSYANSTSNRVQYYNDPKKEKRAKIYKYSIILMAALTAVVMVFKNKGTKSPIFKELSEQIQKNTTNIKKTNTAHKISNLMSNIINVKDDIWDRFINKFKDTPILNIPKKIAQKITNVYKTTISKSMGGKYNKAAEILNQNGYNIQGFDKWYNETNEKFYNVFQKDGERVTDNLFKKGFFKKMTESNIADTKLTNSLGENFFKDEFIKAGENAPKEVIDAVNEFNGIKTTLLTKLRDVNCGSAPTDLLTILSSIGILSVATVAADSKDKKKSTLIDFGIPLLVTLGSTTFATVRCLSGPIALIFGLATGQIAKLTAKGINKALAKNKNET